MKKSLAAAVSLAALFAFTGQAQAADLDTGCVQAVSGFNGKLEGAAGFIDQDVQIANANPVIDMDGSRFHGAGSLSLPLGCMLGLQVDGAAGSLDDNTFAGGAAHLFMRDPSSYLFGVHAMYTSIENPTLSSNDIWRVGPEAEFYLNNFSVEAWAGLEDSDSNGSEFFASVNLAMYATEDFRVHVGFRRFLDMNAFAAGGEWQVSESLPMSLFVEAQFGENDYATVFGGVKFYFGSDNKSLMRRHREDDPRNQIPDLLGFGAQNVAPPPDEDGFCGNLDICVK